MSNREFYFIRHGETELNARKILHDESDICLNDRGRLQAQSMQPIIAQLPIQTICTSPLLRVLETKELVAPNHVSPSIIIEELRECRGIQWQTITEWEKAPEKPFPSEILGPFSHRIQLGLEKALSQTGPVLIVAHGGVHWMLCHLLNIQGYARRVTNCSVVHFFMTESLEWKAELLAAPSV